MHALNLWCLALRLWPPDACPRPQVAVAYAQRAQLDRGARAPTHILLDTVLCDALFKVLPEMWTIVPETRTPKHVLLDAATL
jgi:hypothetical protein